MVKNYLQRKDKEINNNNNNKRKEKWKIKKF
jgi:hypothetical protein